MKILQSNSFLKTTKAITTIGYSLCLGSIASFIAMNIIAEKNPTIAFLYWQRTFVNPIMNYVTIPGIWLFLLGNIGWFMPLNDKTKLNNVVKLGLSILIAINGQAVIVPIAREVSHLATVQFKTSEFIQDFTINKIIEDTCGGINLLFLLAYLATYILTSKTSQIASR